MASKNDLNVLVVDDEKRLTDMIVETFKTFPVFKSVLPSYDGADAIRKISNQKFQLIFYVCFSRLISGAKSGAIFSLKACCNHVNRV